MQFIRLSHQTVQGMIPFSIYDTDEMLNNLTKEQGFVLVITENRLLSVELFDKYRKIQQDGQFLLGALRVKTTTQLLEFKYSNDFRNYQGLQLSAVYLQRSCTSLDFMCSIFSRCRQRPITITNSGSS